MKRFLRSAVFRNLVVIAVVLLAGALTASLSHNASSPLTSAISFVFSPLQKLSAAIADNIDDLSGSFVSSSVYKEENERLEGELQEYRKKLAEYEELKKRVDAYEEFYGIKKTNPDYEFSYGSVISRDAADVYGSFVLDIGSKDGVEANDPVIYGEYVVGVVKKVNLSTCVVYLVTDPRVNIGAFESGTREYGYVSGDEKLYKDGLCKLSGLDSSTSVVGGGIVCTSGAGGVFPNGLIIGEVSAVEHDDISASYYAEVKPFAKLDEITDVFVITSFEGQGEESSN
ncbi:MAG: rod shape-determining protein MreC [Ruminococcaceae bacterium]|nr:rod shape-determining protein MreC [Oscillospiraceae bacterium]